MQAWGNLWHGLPAREIGTHRQDPAAAARAALAEEAADATKRRRPGALPQADINIAPLALTRYLTLDVGWRRSSPGRDERGKPGCDFLPSLGDLESNGHVNPALKRRAIFNSH